MAEAVKKENGSAESLKRPEEFGDSSAKPNKKRKSVGFKSEDESAFVADATQAISLKLVRSRADLDDSSLSFHPSYTLFFFKDEKINGYKGLNVNLYYTALSMESFMAVSFEDKQPPVDNISKLLMKELPADLQPLTNIDSFAERVDKDQASLPTPPGKLVSEYRPASSDAPSDASPVFEIYRGSMEDEPVRAYHHKFQVFSLWLIDGARLIEETDYAWEIYMLFERTTSEGETRRRLAGYVTVYRFYAWHAQDTMFRKRVSQFVILPPFQRQGHGLQLFRAIMSDIRTQPQVKDVTVEDPSEQFSILRDTVNALSAIELGLERPLSARNLSKEKLLQLSAKLKVTTTQVKRLHELCLLKNLDMTDADEYREFRVLVKRRLHTEYRDQLTDNADEVKADLAKLYAETEKDYRSVLRSADKWVRVLGLEQKKEAAAV